MEKTLAKRSGIIYLKSKFFLIRTLTYFSFLLIPVWTQKSGELPFALNGLASLLYILFISSQWFFLGKEIDHRLKIYFRVNSSMDRVVYRLFLGMFFFIIYFNFLYLFPAKWINNLFWTTWVILGLFYSWPTRGKIIQESVTTNFSEFRYLDSFEKTLVCLIVMLFCFSVPELPAIVDQSAIKLFLSPNDTISAIYWNFLTVNYYPFFKYKELYSLSWSMHFYFVNMGLFLICFYALLRFFISRRLSLLGVFIVLSSWSWTKILTENYGSSLSQTYTLLWIWCMMWVSKSSTYRTGLFLGLVNFFGVLINQDWMILWIPQVCMMYFFMRDKSIWFKRQLLRYVSFGGILSLLVALFNSDYFSFGLNINREIIDEVLRLFSRKAIFSLAPIGLFLVALKFSKVKTSLAKWFKDDAYYLKMLMAGATIFVTSDLLVGTTLFRGFTVMWFMAILALFPLELIFQSMSRLRSSRNMVYLIYIMICLLDSHFEGRVKIIIRTIRSLSS